MRGIALSDAAEGEWVDVLLMGEQPDDQIPDYIVSEPQVITMAWGVVSLVAGAGFGAGLLVGGLFL